MSAGADDGLNQPSTRESKEEVRENRRRKRIRERGSQTDEEGAGEEEHNHGCTMCSKKLDGIQEKLDKVLSMLPEIKQLQAKVVKLEKGKNDLKESLELSQAEIAELKNEAASTVTKLAAASDKIAKVDELERRLIKQECHNRRNNIKSFGIQDDDHESPKDTERKLRQFLQKEMKIPSGELEDIEFERVHRIPTRPKEDKGQPRPIIAKVSFFQDKEFIKSCIKNLPKGKKYGVADDFPKEVDEIRKKLHPVLKKAKEQRKMAFFNVEKLIIENAVYRGPETKNFPLYGRIMESG